MDPDPYAATMDAINALRRRRGDHLDPPRDALGLDAQGPRRRASRRTAGCRSSTSSSTSTPSARTSSRTLVVANQTVESEPLHERIVEKNREGNHRFTVIVPASGGARRPERAARAPAEAPGRRGDPGRRPGRPPGPVHRDPERDAVLRRRRHPDLDLRGRALGLAAREPGRARQGRHVAGPSSTSSPAREKVRELMESASIAADHAPRARRAPRPAAREPVVADRAAAARDAAFHHLRGHALRSVLHGLLLHPGRGGRPVAGRGDAPAGRDRGRQHGDPAVVVGDDALGARGREAREPRRAADRPAHHLPARARPS